MRLSATVLDMLQDRGQRGVPVTDLYRQLYNPMLYLRAYGRIYANDGAMTAGSTPETADAMTLSTITKIIDDLRHERYRWTPVRRSYVPKKNGKKRALGLPICLSYCLSFQAMFGIPMVANWVDQNCQSTRVVLLYHVLLLLTSDATFPMLLNRLAKLRDDFWSEGNPAWTARAGSDTLQSSRIAPIRDGRDVHVQQFCGGQGRVTPIATLSCRGHVGAFWTIQRDLVGMANPGDLARGQCSSHASLRPFGVEQRRNLSLSMGWGQFADASDDLLAGLANFPRLFETGNGQTRAGFSLPTNVDGNIIPTLAERHIFDQPAQKLFALSPGGRWSIPEGRQVLRELANVFPLLRRQHQCGWFRQSLVFPFHSIDLLQFLIPLPLQAPRDQPVVRVDR